MAQFDQAGNCMESAHLPANFSGNQTGLDLAVISS
jgi:hypothetical protein